jgi:DNA-binding CsgD family transcriptional regulator
MNPIGIAFLTPKCEVIQLNSLMTKILGDRDGLALINNRIYASDEREGGSLRRFAEKDRNIPYALMRISRQRQYSYYLAMIAPAEPMMVAEFAGPESGIVMLSVIDAEHEPSVPPEAMMELFQLTPAEARVATEIGKGRRIEDIALDASVSIGTVKNQLKSVFSKIGLNRQADLMKLAANIGSIIQSHHILAHIRGNTKDAVKASPFSEMK